VRKVLWEFKRTVPVPWGLFTRILRSEAKKTARVPGGLDKDQRGVHHFVVMNLPSLAGPRASGFVADHLRIRKAQVI
jgi:hypothetical protein